MGGRVEQLTGTHVVREALRARRRKLLRLRVAGRPDRDLLALAEAAGVPVEAVDPSRLPRSDDRAGPQGASLEAGPLPDPRLEDLVRGDDSELRLVLLDGVEDPHNLGAIARVAEAAGAAGIVQAQRRAAPPSPAASRASAGALEWLPVARVPNLRNAIRFLKQRDFWVVATDAAAEDDLYALSDRVLSGRLVVALGAEGKGLRPGVLEEADHRVRIPMLGRIGSLNVSTAGAVVLYEILRRSRS